MQMRAGLSMRLAPSSAAHDRLPAPIVTAAPLLLYRLCPRAYLVFLPASTACPTAAPASLALAQLHHASAAVVAVAAPAAGAAGLRLGTSPRILRRGGDSSAIMQHGGKENSLHHTNACQ
jgi:hypothetical protein